MWRGLFYSSIGSIGTIGTNGMNGQSTGILLLSASYYWDLDNILHHLVEGLAYSTRPLVLLVRLDYQWNEWPVHWYSIGEVHVTI